VIMACPWAAPVSGKDNDPFDFQNKNCFQKTLHPTFTRIGRTAHFQIMRSINSS
jgi:hypothetical protein